MSASQKNPGLTQLFEQSGDAHVGQTLMRLATLAAANHRAQQATRVADLDMQLNDSPREDQREPHGRRSGHVVADSVTTTDRALHTEVER